MERVSSIPRSFGRHDHGRCSSAHPLSQGSSSRVNEIFILDLVDRDAKALLKEGRLQSGIGF